ncbi:hypothetical protein Pelo_18630 [Pelomyxa schiedti]|nr:hypothetical protein Pelo_18630 [Pelomyxa schiedti]
MIKDSRCGDNTYDFRVGSLCAGVVMSTTWKFLQSITGTFTWDPSSRYLTHLSDEDHIATGLSVSGSAATVWTTQCVTTGSVAVARITLIQICLTPCIGVVGPAITSNQPTPLSGSINRSEGFWGFNLYNRNSTCHDRKPLPEGDHRNGCDNTPDGTVITVTVDMTHPGDGGMMSVRVGDCDRGVVCCTGLPSPLRFAFSACCGGHVIKIE